MEIGTTHVHVTPLSTHQQHGRQSVNEDTDACCPRYGDAIHLRRLLELMIALYQNATDGYEEQNGIDERDEHSRLLIAVGVAFVGLYLCQLKGDENQHQTEHVAQVMACVGEQRERILKEPYQCLYPNEEQVKYNRKNKDAAKRCHFPPMMMVVMMSMMMMSLFHIFIMFNFSFSPAKVH